MKKSKRLVYAAAFVLCLCSCASTQPGDKAFERVLIDPQKDLAGSEQQIEETTRMGPAVKEIEPDSFRRAPTRIHTEKSPSPMKIDRQTARFPVTLNLNNVEVKTFANMLSLVTGFNIVVGDEVEGTVTARFVDVPWNKVLDTVLKMKSLAKHVDVEANIIRIHGREELGATEEFDRKREADLQRDRDLKLAGEPIHTEIFKLYYTDPETVKKEILEVFGKVTEEGKASSSAKKLQITIDNRVKSLIVMAGKESLKLIEKLIHEIDVRTPQVLIEAFIVEATDDFKRELGSRIAFNNQAQTFTGGTGTGLQVGGGAPNLLYILSTSLFDLEVELDALEKEGVTKILSNPHVFTLDNEEAVIKQGYEIPYRTVDEEGNAALEFKEVMLELTVTPSVVGYGNVILKLNIKKDSADTTVEDPPITKNEITTGLLVPDKQTVVIGGIFIHGKSDGESKVPSLGDFPVLGWLFKKKSSEIERKELLVFISPRII